MKRKSNSIKKRVRKHLLGDIKTFKSEAQEDRELLKKLKKEPIKKVKKAVRKSGKKYYAQKRDIEQGEKRSHERKESNAQKKIERVMREYKGGKLHSGSKKGPMVKSRKQAIAIAMSESRRKKKRK